MNTQPVDAEKSLSDLVAKGVHIPPWPQVLRELKETLDSGDYDARTLARVLGKDAGLAAMVFKVSRSPVFARGSKKLDRLDQVMMVLGIKQVLNIVQALALTAVLSSRESKAAFEAFWTRSEQIAKLAALIAEDRVSVCNVFPDQAYMAGIFRECGVPVLMLRFPDYCKTVDLARTSCWPNIVEENQRFNLDHCVIGYLIAKHWKLPDFIASAIYYHREMPKEELGPVLSVVAMLHLASHFHSRIYGGSNPEWVRFRSEVFDELGIHPDAEKELYLDVHDKYMAATD